MSDRQHAIDYIELTVRDLEEAKCFFTAALGWSFNDYGPGYAGIVRGEGEMGGLAVGECTPPPASAPLVVLYSADLESSRARVQDAGGRIVKDIFEFPGGRRFRFADPSGNELAIWSQS